MSAKLKAGQACPFHHGNRFCCGRETRTKKPSKYTQVRPGVRRVTDPTDPLGYREIISPAERTRRKYSLSLNQRSCLCCGKVFDDYDDVELCHRHGKGAGGGKHQDDWSNLFLGCRSCNREQGSMTLDQYLAWRREKGLPTP